MLLVMLGYESTDPCDENCRKSILRCFIEGAFIADFARKLGDGVVFLIGNRWRCFYPFAS